MHVVVADELVFHAHSIPQKRPLGGSLSGFGREATVAAGAAMDREGFGGVLPGSQVTMATGDRECTGRYVLAGGAAVVEQDKQHRLPVHVDSRLAESFCQVDTPRTKPQPTGGHDTARA